MENYTETIREIWGEISKHNKITIFTHKNPDGDTLGTAVAFKELINQNFENKEVKIAGAKVPKNFTWMIEHQEVEDEFVEDSIALLVDTSNLLRTADLRIIKTKKILKVDHHHPEGDRWEMVIDGDDWAATGEIVYDFIKELNLKFNKEALEAIFVAIWTDTSGLQERDPSEHTFEAIKFLEENGVDRNKIIENLDFSDEDKKSVEPFIEGAKFDGKLAYKINDEIMDMDIYRYATEQFVQRNDAEVYIFAVKKEEDMIRVGFRSKQIDVSAIATHFGGGGHKLSAGCYAHKISELDEIIRYTLYVIEKG